VIPWPPGDHDEWANENDTDWDIVTTSASTDSIVTIPAATTYTDPYWNEEEEARLARLRAEADERRRRARLRDQAAARRKQRQGRGHDPRKQVICRARSHGRGKGRR
jgi:hypothetical protein